MENLIGKVQYLHFTTFQQKLLQNFEVLLAEKRGNDRLKKTNSPSLKIS